jgi:restriction endonuclease S subunit
MSVTKQILPKGWGWTKLGDICQTTSGGTPQRGVKEYYNGNIPWVKSGELNDGLITSVEESITELGIKNSSAKIFPAGTLLIALYGATVGRLGILNIDAATNQAVCAIYTGNNVDKNFLFFYLLSKRNDLLKISFGGAQPNISQEIVRSIPIPLPPLDEQKRIASRLEEQMRHIEQARQAAEESLSAAWELPSKYLREVFDNDIANMGARIRLGEILNLRKEVVHPYNNPKGPAVFVGLEHIEANSGIRVGSVEVEMSKLTGRKPKFYKGDIVYGYLRPYLNKVWVAEFDGLCSVDQYVYSIDESKVDVDFIAWFMRSPVYLERAPIDTTPGQLPRIRTEEVASVLINLPTLEEQKRISLQISEQHNTVNKLIASLESQLAEINELPSALLRQAFAGELST